MSDGLNLIAAIVNSQSVNTLLRTDREKFTTAEQTVFDFLQQFYRQYRTVPELATIQSETGQRLPNATENLEFYVTQFEDRFIYNEIRDRYAAMRESMQRRDVNEMRNLVGEMQGVMNHRRQSGHSVSSFGDAIGLVNTRLIRTMGMGGITGIETPWATFNEVTGGYQDGDLITIVGRPATSKTYNLLCQALAAHDAGHSPMIITTEMGTEQIGRRLVALKLGINPEAMKKNMISTYSMRRIQALQAEMMSDERMRIVSVGMGAKISTIEALIQEFGPSIVYLDGSYLIHPSVKAQMKRIERVGEVFDELKGLTISANIPIVNTMQFNRQAGKDGKDGSLETIGFTDAVGMHSSLVIGLKQGPTENPRASRTMEFLKGREGEIGSIHINFKFAPVDMSEIPPEQISTNAEGEAVVTTPAGEGAAPAGVDWMM